MLVTIGFRGNYHPRAPEPGETTPVEIIAVWERKGLRVVGWLVHWTRWGKRHAFELSWSDAVNYLNGQAHADLKETLRDVWGNQTDEPNLDYGKTYTPPDPTYITNTLRHFIDKAEYDINNRALPSKEATEAHERMMKYVKDREENKNRSTADHEGHFIMHNLEEWEPGGAAEAIKAVIGDDYAKELVKELQAEPAEQSVNDKSPEISAT